MSVVFVLCVTGYRCFKAIMFLTGCIFGTTIVYYVTTQDAVLPQYAMIGRYIYELNWFEIHARRVLSSTDEKRSACRVLYEYFSYSSVNYVFYARFRSQSPLTADKVFEMRTQ